MQKTLSMIVTRLPLLESSNVSHQPPIQDKEDSYTVPPLQHSYNV